MTTPPKTKGHSGRAAVVDGRMVYTSVSAIKKFDDRSAEGCNRRWWFRYVARLPEPAFAAQETGTTIHAQIEHYLKTGEDVLGPIARLGKHLMPEPGPHLMIEAPLEGSLDAADVPMVGFIDCVDSRGVEVIDWKTSSNVKRYAKTGEQLEHDTQMLGYGEWVRRTFPGSEAVTLSHVYFPTKGPSLCVKSTTVVPLKTVNHRWQSEIVPVVEKMKTAAGEACHDNVAKNESACFSYGKPCPYMKECRQNDDPIARLSMSLLNKLRNVTSPATGLPVPPGAETVDGPRYSPQQQALLKVDALGEPLKKLVIEEVAQVLPPDAPASDPELAAECEPCAETGKAGKQHKLADCPTLNAPPEAPKKRGRPKKTDAEPVAPTPGGIAVSAYSPAFVPAAPTPEPIVSSFGVAFQPAPGFDLYVDAIPSVPFTRLESYVRDLHTEVIEKGAGQPDMALVEFGKGRGLMRAAAKLQPPPPGVYVVSRSDTTDPVIEALAPLARMVVRGVR